MTDDFAFVAQSGNEDHSELMDKYLTFWTDKQLYGVPIANVVQIVKMQTINPIPDYPDYAKGVIDLRGTILPVIDIRLRIGKMEAEYDERTCIVVTTIKDTYVGFIVDAVDEVTVIKGEQISDAPRISNEYNNPYLTGVGNLEGRIILLLDTAKLINASEFEQLSAGLA